MGDTVAVMISSASLEAVSTALDLVDAAVSMEMPVHVYLTGGAVALLAEGGGAGAPSAEERAAVLARVRSVKEEGEVTVYACSRAMAAHGIDPDALPAEVDMPAGFAYFLSVAGDAAVTLNF